MKKCFLSLCFLSLILVSCTRVNKTVLNVLEPSNKLVWEETGLWFIPFNKEESIYRYKDNNYFISFASDIGLFDKFYLNWATRIFEDEEPRTENVDYGRILIGDKPHIENNCLVLTCVEDKWFGTKEGDSICFKIIKIEEAN